MRVSGLVLLCALFAGESGACGKSQDYEPVRSHAFPGFFWMETVRQVSNDAYFRDKSLVFRNGGACVDLGKEFTSEALISASQHFQAMDFLRQEELEEFLRFLFQAWAEVGPHKIPAYLAYSKEDGIDGTRFIMVGVPTFETISVRWGAYERFAIPKLECLSVNRKGRFTRGDKGRCEEAIERYLGFFMEGGRGSG